ncbi:MAG: hypothetical protein ACPG19_13130 [Saprospiraceae bacterium]
MKLFSLGIILSLVAVSANKCGNVFDNHNYDCELINFKTDAVFDTIAAHVSGRVFSRDGSPIEDFSVAFIPEEATYPSDTFEVNKKGKFGYWLSTKENTFFIHILKNNRLVDKLPQQRINGGTAYWADIQVKKR